MDLEATHLRGRTYAVRPPGQLGTCGWYPRAWTVVYVTADSPQEAVRRARGKVLSPPKQGATDDA